MLPVGEHELSECRKSSSQSPSESAPPKEEGEAAATMGGGSGKSGIRGPSCQVGDEQ